MTDASRYAIATDGLRLLAGGGNGEVIRLPAVFAVARTVHVRANAELVVLSGAIKLNTYRAIADVNSVRGVAKIRRVVSGRARDNTRG